MENFYLSLGEFVSANLWTAEVFVFSLFAFGGMGLFSAMYKSHLQWKESQKQKHLSNTLILGLGSIVFLVGTLPIFVLEIINVSNVTLFPYKISKLIFFLIPSITFVLSSSKACNYYKMLKTSKNTSTFMLMSLFDLISFYSAFTLIISVLNASISLVL